MPVFPESNGQPSPDTSMTLLQAVVRGEPEARRKLVEVYGNVIFRKCRRSGLGEDAAQDLAHDVLVRVFKHIGTFRRNPPEFLFRKWLAVIIRNTVRSALKSHIYSRESIAGESTLFDSLIDTCDDETAFTFRDPDLLQSIREAMQQVEQTVNSVHFQVFLRATVDGLSATDVASEFGLQAADVRKINQRIRRQLVEVLRLEGILEIDDDQSAGG